MKKSGAARSRSRDRNVQYTRISQLKQLLSTSHRGYTIKEIHALLAPDHKGISDRTIRRDLQGLMNVESALIARKDTNGANPVMRYRIDKAKSVAALELDATGVLALVFARRVLESSCKTQPLASDIKRLFNVIEHSIGKRSLQYFTELAGAYKSAPTHGGILACGIDIEILEATQSACVESQVLEIDYRSAYSGKAEKRFVGPHCVFVAKGNIYLVAEDLKSKTVKHYALARMRRARMTETPYDGPVVEIEKHLGSGIGVFVDGSNPQDVVLRFQASATPYVNEHPVHPSQIIEELPDGSCEVKLRVSLTPDFIAWLLGFGSAVVVQSPKALRDRVVSALKDSVANYG